MFVILGAVDEKSRRRMEQERTSNAGSVMDTQEGESKLAFALVRSLPTQPTDSQQVKHTP